MLKDSSRSSVSGYLRTSQINAAAWGTASAASSRTSRGAGRSCNEGRRRTASDVVTACNASAIIARACSAAMGPRVPAAPGEQCREARVRGRVSAAGSTSSSRRSLPRSGSDILFDRLEAEALSWRALAPRARDQGVEPGVGGDEQVLAFLARQQAEQRNRPAPPRQDDGAPRRLPGVLREGSGRSRQFNPRHDRSISTPPTNTRSLTLTPIARIVTQGSGVSLTS